MSERSRRGNIEPHDAAFSLIPLRAGEAPGAVAFALDRKLAQAASVANRRVAGVNLLHCPDFICRSSTMGHLGPLHGPSRFAAVDFENVAIATGIEQHECHCVRSLPGVSPTQAIVKR